jgi:hypothetical protein
MGLALLAILVVALSIRHFRNKRATTADEQIDYDVEGEPELAQTHPLAKDFGTTSTHPHRQT